MGKLLMKIHYQLVLVMNFFDVDIVKTFCLVLFVFSKHILLLCKVHIITKQMTTQIV